MSLSQLLILPELRGLPVKVRNGLDRLRWKSNQFLAIGLGVSWTVMIGGAIVGIVMFVDKRISMQSWFQGLPLVVRTLIVALCITAVFIALCMAACLMLRPWDRSQLHGFIRRTWLNGRPPICYACNYDLRGSPGPTCPECGEKIPTLADLGMADEAGTAKSDLKK